MQTGVPFTVNLKGDTAGVGAGTGGILVRPNAVPGVAQYLPSSQRSTSAWFNTAAFLAPAQGTFGNLGRNTVIGPGFVNLDLVLVKGIHIGESLPLELRAETFHVSNTPTCNILCPRLNHPT